MKCRKYVRNRFSVIFHKNHFQKLLQPEIFFRNIKLFFKYKIHDYGTSPYWSLIHGPILSYLTDCCRHNNRYRRIGSVYCGR